MDYVVLPIIIVCCYLIGEVYKVLFKKNKNAYKLIPIVLAIIGGIFGLIIYYLNPEMIFNVSNPFVALGIGIASGASSTGSNQIIKQLFKENDSNAQ